MISWRKGHNSLADLKGNYVNTGGIEGGANGATDAISWSGNIAGSATTAFNSDLSLIVGVELGKNTDANGKIYLKAEVDNDGKVQVSAYKDEKMEAKDLVAQSDWTQKSTVANAGVVTLNEVRNSDNTAGTGLGMVLQASNGIIGVDSLADNSTTTGNLTFNNIGARIFATEYGSEHYVKVTQDKGAIFTSYDSVGESKRTLLDAGERGQTKLIQGQDATVSINGMEVKTNGLELKVATQDIQADLTFNAGKVGSTTVAQVGYGIGSLFTKAGALNMGEMAKGAVGSVDEGLSAYLCNAGHNTQESIGDFQGGMQLQLGEGAGDQNRTTVSMRSMTSENLGRVKIGGYWDTANPAVYTEKQLTLKDAMGGGFASLRSDPTLTMKVIDTAIDDVATQRAIMGAQQSNLLQTNANNLEVTLENITKTEAGIRDTDMATEMAEFTKNQVLQNAAMSMMSQANQQSQSALQLLR